MQNKNRIKILPSTVIDQIAAGEVVERPASVVKELIENSIDAGSDLIEISIEGGGLDLISVQDDGHGISFDELPLAVSRHATSKISSFQDLEDINTFGFRGEALPSIGAVSILEIASICEGEELGGKIVVEYGKVTSHIPYVINKGTQVNVKNLFLNVPARLKFLKSKSYERKKCEDIVFKMAIANPDKEIKLVSEKKQLLFPKNQTLKDRLALIWGKEVIEKLIYIENKYMGYRIHGFVSSMEKLFHNSEKIIIYINNRPVHNKIVLNAIKAGYEGKLLKREYPYAVIFIDIPPSDVDVNVHPAKLEVRFKNERAIFLLIYKAISNAITQKTNFFYLINQEINEIVDNTSYKTEQIEQPIKNLLIKDTRKKLQIKKRYEQDDTELQYKITYLGQLYNTYLIFLHNDIPVILDQHAAHEKILYIKYRNTKFQSKLLSIPIVITLSPQDISFYESIKTSLKKIGFEMELDKKNVLLIKKIPEIFDTEEAKDLIEKTITTRIDSIDDFWKASACKKAIKANEKLSTEEAIHLIKTWLTTPEREFCPHGRPTSFILTSDKLQSLFKRK